MLLSLTFFHRYTAWFALQASEGEVAIFFAGVERSGSTLSNINSLSISHQLLGDTLRLNRGCNLCAYVFTDRVAGIVWYLSLSTGLFGEKVSTQIWCRWAQWYACLWLTDMI